VKQDVNGTTTVHEYPFEPDTIDAGVEDEGKTTRFWNCRPPVCSVEGDFMVGPSQEPRIGDDVIGVNHTQAGPLQQFTFALGL
jgi:hypothetical protein